MAFTAKQQAFISEFLVDMNATAAAIRAGYSAKTAKQIGFQNLRIPEIRAAIDAAKDARAEKVGVDAAWVLARLFSEAQADIADLYDPETGELKPVHSWPQIFRTGLVAGVETEQIYEGTGKNREHVGTTYKVRFENRGRRVELIGKHVNVKAFQDQIAVAGLDDLAARLDRAKKRAAERG